MKKRYLTVALVSALIGSMSLTSCIGSFALTKNVMEWNKQVSNKFVNELVFFAFWVLPVYEVTSVADLLVINSIEFWSGTNPLTASTKAIDTDHGRYLVDCDGTGYTVTDPNGNATRLNFTEETQTWSVEIDGEDVPFMTYVDDNHVKMITPEGDFRMVELNAGGVMAYRQATGNLYLASR